MKKLLVAVFLFTVYMAIPAVAQKAAVFTHERGAISGYDPVAYFTAGKPVEGKKAFTYSWNGADWYFSTAANKEAFEASPEKYAPQYGGYCAYGMSKGYKAPTDPEAWTIRDNKLYLNYNKKVQQTWNENQQEFIEKADKNWPEVVNKE
jgi:YHS domain-containing protein